MEPDVPADRHREDEGPHPELLGSDADLVGRGARHGHPVVVVVVDDDTVARGQTRPREQSVKSFPCDLGTLFTIR